MKKILMTLCVLSPTLMFPQDQDKTAYLALQGDTLMFALESHQCTGKIEVFGKTYECTSGYRLIIGVDVAQKPGTYPVTRKVFYDNTPQEEIVRTIQVQERHFPEKQMKPPRFSPVKNRDLEIIEINVALTEGERKYFFQNFSSLFVAPLDAITVTDEFGTKRSYTVWQKKKPVLVTSPPHRGVDLRADSGTPVRAAGNGIVVCASRFSLEGNMVIVYHGSGVYSLYMHLKEFKVHHGESVSLGKIIALSDNTGASAGPHLHFAVKIKGANVDPLYFLRKLGAKVD